MSVRSRPLPRLGALTNHVMIGLTALLALILLASVGPALPAVLQRLMIPYQIDPSEGVIVAETRLLLQGVNVWLPVRADLFTAAPYPPLYYLLLLPAMAAGLPPFAAARGLTLAAVVLLAVLLLVMVTRQTRQPAAGLLAAGLWLAPNLVAVWAVRARPDLLALALNLAGLALVWSVGEAQSEQPLRTNERAHWLGWLRPTFSSPLVIAAFLCAAAFFFKHTALAAPAAAGLYLLLRSRPAAIGFGLVYATAVIIPYVAFDLVTGGGFTEHLVSFHRSWLWSNYLELVAPFARHYWLLVLLPVAAAAVEIRVRGRPGLPTIWLAMAMIVSLAGGTHGGNNNHLLEVLLATALAIGSTVGLALGGRLAIPTLLVAVAATLVLVWEPTGGQAWLTGDLRPPSATEQAGWQQVTTVVQKDPGPVFSDNAGLLATTGHDVWVTDPFTMAGSVSAGLWSDAELVEAVRQRRFSLIGLRYDVNRLRGVPTDISPDLLAAIREHYDVAERNVLFLYRPKPTQ